MKWKVEPGCEWWHLRHSGRGIGDDMSPAIWVLVTEFGPYLYDGRHVNDGTMLLIDEKQIGASWCVDDAIHCLIRVRDICGIVTEDVNR